MGLFGLGRSPIKSSDPKAREQAVRDLPVAEQGTFIEVALGDDDPAVRLAAAARVRETDYLQHLARHKDPAVAKIGRDRLAAVAVDEVKRCKPGAARGLLEHIDEQNALATIALQAAHAEVRRLACERLLAQDRPSEAMLARIAIQDEQGELARQVVARIDKRQHLKEVGRKAKDAAVRAVAADRLAAIEHDAQQPSREQRRRERARRLAELVDRARAIAAEDDLAAGDERFAALLAEFERVVAGDRDLPEDDTVREARLAIERVRGGFLRQREEQAAAAGGDEPTAAAATAEASAEGDAASAEAEVEVYAGVEDAQRPVVEELLAAIERVAEAPEAEDAEQQVFELDKRWRTQLGELGNEHPARQRFLAAWQAIKDARRAARERRKQEQAERAERLAPLVDEAEALAAREPTDDELPAHRDALKDLQARRKALGRVGGKRGGDLHRRFRDACDRAYLPVKRLHQAKEWERFARASRAEELIAAAAGLAEVTDLEELFERAKALQADWKAMGPLPRERNDELWGAFKGHCDAVYERLQPLFAARDAERAENLAKKRELLAEVEQLADGGSIGIAGSQADRDAMKQRFDRMQALHAEWQATGPVPRGEDRDLWRAYRAARDRFFAARRESFKAQDEERVENLNQKLALIVAAEELAEDFERYLAGTPVGSKSEPDFLREVKAIQKRFREIGFVPRDRFPEIRDRFKAACDRVYQGLEPWFAKQDEARQANLERKRELLTEIEELLEEERPDWFKDDAAKVRQQWREAGPVPRAEMEIEDRFRAACAKIFDT